MNNKSYTVKRKLYKLVVRPAILHGTATWTINI